MSGLMAKKNHIPMRTREAQHKMMSCQGALWWSMRSYKDCQSILQRANERAAVASGKKIYIKVNNISHIISSPEAFADTNKSFRMFYQPLYTVHQTALKVERKKAACNTQTMSEKEECDLCLV